MEIVRLVVIIQIPHLQWTHEDTHTINLQLFPVARLELVAIIEPQAFEQVADVCLKHRVDWKKSAENLYL